MGAFHLVKISGISVSAAEWNTFRRFVPLEKFPEREENLKRWTRFPGWNFRTEFRVTFTRFSLHQFHVHGKKICQGQLANQNGFPRAHVYVLMHGPTMEALLHHECPVLGLIGKYLVMSNSN